MRTLVIIPTYNEAENIQTIISRILELPTSTDLLIVDDNSPDGTADIIQEKFSTNGRVNLLRREKKLGLGTAYTAGFHYGMEKNYIGLVTMDADFSHNPLTIPQLLHAGSEFDIVIGSRYIPGGRTINWGIFRKLLSHVANLVTKYFLSLPFHDCTSGFRFYKAEALRKLHLETIRADGYSYLVEILHRAVRCNLRVGELPIEFVERRRGKSKISRKEIVKAMQTVLRLRFQLRSDQKRMRR